jgi:hypothetical protein
VKAGFENVPTDGPDAWSLTRDFMTMSKIGIMQEFPREEKRKLKAERAERDAERSAVAIESTTLAIKREAATAWLARRYADDTERAIAAQVAEAELAVTTVGAAYRAGSAAERVDRQQSMVVELRNRKTESAAQTVRGSLPAISAPCRTAAGEAPDIRRRTRRGSTTSTRNRAARGRSRSQRRRPTSPELRSFLTGAVLPSAARRIRTWSRCFRSTCHGRRERGRTASTPRS